MVPSVATTTSPARTGPRVVCTHVTGPVAGRRRAPRCGRGCDAPADSAAASEPGGQPARVHRGTAVDDQAAVEAIGADLDVARHRRRGTRPRSPIDAWASATRAQVPRPCGGGAPARRARCGRQPQSMPRLANERRRAPSKAADGVVPQRGVRRAWPTRRPGRACRRGAPCRRCGCSRPARPRRRRPRRRRDRHARSSKAARQTGQPAADDGHVGLTGRRGDREPVRGSAPSHQYGVSA